LEKEGITIYPEQVPENLATKPQLVIYSAAVPATNPELAAALEQKIPAITYPEAVGILTKSFKTISIAGTHGKTTTTALASLALTANQFDPTVIVGALLKEFEIKTKESANPTGLSWNPANITVISSIIIRKSLFLIISSPIISIIFPMPMIIKVLSNNSSTNSNLTE
jgi:hypothetical protein